jgi:hypothetical protein
MTFRVERIDREISDNEPNNIVGMGKILAQIESMARA